MDDLAAMDWVLVAAFGLVTIGLLLVAALIVAVVLAAAGAVLAGVFLAGRELWYLVSDALARREFGAVEYRRDRAVRDILRIRQVAVRRMIEVEQQERWEWVCREVERRGW